MREEVSQLDGSTAAMRQHDTAVQLLIARNSSYPQIKARLGHLLEIGALVGLLTV